MFKSGFDENYKLIKLAQSNSPQAVEARELLFSNCQTFLDKLASKSRNLSHLAIPINDFQQEAYLGFLEALGSYRMDRGAKFTTFLYRVVMNRLKKFADNEWGIQKNQQHVEVPEVSFSGTRKQTRGGDLEPLIKPTSVVDEEQVKAGELSSFVSNLTTRQKEVVEAIFWSDVPCKEVARRMGVSPQMVNKILNQVYSRGRQNLNQ